MSHKYREEDLDITLDLFPPLLLAGDGERLLSLRLDPLPSLDFMVSRDRLRLTLSARSDL